MAKKYRKSRKAKSASRRKSGKAKPHNLASMSVDALLDLRDKVQEALGSIASGLEKQLGRIGGADGAGKPNPGLGHAPYFAKRGSRGGKVSMPSQSRDRRW